MAIKNIIASDISGDDLTEDTHARIVISDHPSLGGAVELDVSVAEAAMFNESKVELVSLAIYEPNKAPRRVVLDVAAFNEAFNGVDVDSILKGARKAETEAPKRTRRSGTGTASSPKVDYLSKDKFGVLHRGKVTDEEAALVRANLEQANKNREAAGQPAIDPNDAKEAKRYGF